MEQKKKTSILYIQITAGRGPAECCWAVAQVLKELIKRCREMKLEALIVERQKGTQPGTLSSALIEVHGVGAKRQLASWQGTIQWIGKSPYRKFHKRKNWFIGISFFEAERQKELKSYELEFQTFRASGPGGQHRNKVESAVRVIHKPSGLIATEHGSRSQYQNKQGAIKKLNALFQNQSMIDQKKQTEEQWVEHLSLQRGNPVKVFQGRAFEEVK
ncbi:peptide chain release factor H [Fulvivirga sp. M361]|uniref:peptide chain release factor H n=1 Tax=Fulvivirga sp. M361 TaxID=2594266 RepID=UPI0011799623|nr:peptide chain release factor H [Fulvivirga sp. M361]TRX62738.1 peptide chain release factor H [Fulvivirga sp. M361]